LTPVTRFIGAFVFFSSLLRYARFLQDFPQSPPDPTTFKCHRKSSHARREKQPQHNRKRNIKDNKEKKNLSYHTRSLQITGNEKDRWRQRPGNQKAKKRHSGSPPPLGDHVAVDQQPSTVTPAKPKLPQRLQRTPTAHHLILCSNNKQASLPRRACLSPPKRPSSIQMH
jgi:hypothetical protein